jgi:hypothetical protein
MGSRHLAVLAAFALGISVVGGVAIAAGKPTELQACTNSAGVLRLLSPNGSCPTTFHKVAISEQGPRGARGPRGPKGATGPAGPRGLAGQTGPDAKSTIATAKAPTGVAVALRGTRLTVTAQCTPTTISKLVITGTGHYLVHGVSELANNGNLVGRTDSHPVDVDVPSVIDTGSSLIDFETKTTDASTTSDVVVSGTSGTANLSTDLLLTSAGMTFTIDTFLSLGPDTCEAAAQITPTA